VWIGGEAGSGKTALLRAALGALPQGFTVLAAEADELAGDIPFYLARQLGVADATAAFPAGLELLQAWSRAQEAGPTAVAVEELQHRRVSPAERVRQARYHLPAPASPVRGALAPH